jgi:pimeloyl-ACP methyl ester carboxylesterase
MPTTDVGVPKHFIVIVPGYMGSLLQDSESGETVWLDIPRMLMNPLGIPKAIDRMFEKMTYPNPDIKPAGIINQVLFVPPWAKLEQYGRLLERLRRWGYQLDPQDPAPDDLAAYTFAYDWRQDNRISGEELGRAVENWRDRHNGAKAILIGHSNGGIISRWYIQKCGGAEHVLRLFLMGSPWDGSPKTIKMLESGLEVLGLRRLNLFNFAQRIKDVILSFPSAYQIIPHTNPFLRDQDNRVVDLYADPSWLKNQQHQAYLADALKFNQELGTDLDVDTLCFFGRQKPTVTTGVVTLAGDGSWRDLKWVSTTAGDGTVSEFSAVHPQAHAKLPFTATHGDIYVVDAVLEFLQWELLGKYRGAVRASLATDRYMVVFEPEKDLYEPQEEILVWAQITSLDGKETVDDADVKATLVFHEPLPGVDPVVSPSEVEEVRLRSSRSVPGRYEARIPAPQVEGYYRLDGWGKIVGEPQINLQELISVENPPG